MNFHKVGREKRIKVVLEEFIILMSPIGRPEIKNSSDKNIGAPGCQYG